MSLTRAKFESLTADLTNRCREPFLAALKDAGLTPQEIDEVVLVGGATRMPVVQELVKELCAGKEPHKGVNPDEVVAVGAAIQAGVLRGDLKDVVLLDVTPLSLGVETLGGVMTRLIERNTTIPTSRTETFTTAEDNQQSVEIHVLQGERELARDNRTLARFHLEGIPPALRGVPQIEVTFDIDANGILTVRAREKSSGREQTVRVEAATTLSQDEVERMVKEAQAHVAEDRALRETVELRNQADQMAYQAEKTIRENGDRLPSELREEAERAIESVRQATRQSDANVIRKAMDDLNSTLQKVGQQVYAPAGAQGEKRSGTNNEDDVVDAEYREAD
jgi:molecular chaperone DnaK